MTCGVLSACYDLQQHIIGRPPAHLCKMTHAHVHLTFSSSWSSGSIVHPEALIAASTRCHTQPCQVNMWLQGVALWACCCRVKRHKASNNINAAVMTMSLAGPRSQSLNDAIDAASNAGITVITAAGEGSRFRLDHCTQRGSGHDAAASCAAALSHGDNTVLSPSCSALNATLSLKHCSSVSGPLATLNYT